MSIKIITDSACDMPENRLKELGVETIPLYILQGDHSYKDGVDITAEMLYKAMKGGKIFKTSQIPYADFLSVFTRYAQAEQPFIHLSFSSGLSGTYQTAVLALRDVREKYPDVPMAVVDTKAVTGGLGLLVERVAAAAAKGASFDALLEYAEELSRHIRHVFTVTNLEYLYRGGRLNKGSAMVGNMLKICPMLIVDEKGELANIDKARGERKLMRKMVDYVGKTMAAPETQALYVTQADGMDLARSFLKIARHHFTPKTTEILTLAPIIGTHTGPGTLTVHYFDAEVPDII
jgi:DegV family protein with EDD domain